MDKGHPANNVQIEQGWKKILSAEFDKPYYKEIETTLLSAKQEGKVIYPPEDLIFNAFNKTPWGQAKVVILGQDPYHNPGQAMGLSFSVPQGFRVPPSLRNVYKELYTDLAVTPPPHGDLTAWANQGVLLLNVMLTVEHKQPGSHRKIGWQHFTNAVISALSAEQEGIVFMLWGNFAIAKAGLIDDTRHLILHAAHPSPLARGAYFGSKHFSQANAYLIKQAKTPINWQL